MSNFYQEELDLEVPKSYKIPPDPPKWATYRPFRDGADFKFHTNIGHVKNSMRRGGVAYEWDGSKWRVRLDVPNPYKQTEEDKKAIKELKAIF